MKFIFLLIFIPSFASGQLKCSVVNSNSNLPVPYATVGFKTAKVGLTTNENGMFVIDTNTFARDTLIISSVGYKTFEIAVSSVLITPEIKLEEHQLNLREVRLYSGKLQNEITIDEFSNCTNHSYTTSGFITQVAKLFEAPVSNAMLSDVFICTSNRNSIFRLRLYEIDSITRKPSFDLIDTVIEIKAKKRKIHISLDAYKVYLPDKEFFVAIEWLKIPYNEDKVKIEMGGEKAIHINYAPFISMKSIEPDEHNLPRSFHLDYLGNWYSLFNYDRDILISVTLKY